jgi:predicted metal-dependent HD superfamily phosphohydrolase
MLEVKFHQLCQQFSARTQLIETLYEEIRTHHTERTRYYHNLRHLSQLYEVLEPIELNPIYEFTLFYHDIIYDVQQRDNEVQSADLAQNRLQSLAIPHKILNKVYELILATQTHQSSNLKYHTFLDADLSILGASTEQYQQYAYAVRKEYQIYDEKSYQKGRQKVLKHFLEKPHIYLTEHFQKTYEKQAQLNLIWELDTLS